MGMTVKQLNQFLDSLKTPRFSIMLRAQHAKGKSDVIRQFAIRRKLYSIDLRLGQRDLGDILGMPVVVDGDVASTATDYEKLLAKRFLHVLPELMRPCFVTDLKELGVMGDASDMLADQRPDSDIGKPYEGICFFADEMNRGTKDVMQAMFQAVLDREMNGKKLNRQCWIFTAINDDLDVYTVTEFDPALLSRFMIIDFEPTVEEWLSWGKTTGKLCDEVMFCIQQNKEIADPPSTKEKDDIFNGPHPNRRSWTMFSAWFDANRDKFALNFIKTVCIGFVGEGAAEIFRLSVEQYQQTKASRKNAESEETKKVDSFVKKFFRYNELSIEEAKTEFQALNVSEKTQLIDAVIQYFAQFKFLSGNARTSLKSFVQVADAEFFAKMWANFNDALKPKLLQADPDTYKKFENV